MKWVKITFILPFVAILLGNCKKSFLDREALGYLNENNLANKSGVEGLLIGAYSMLDGIGGNKSGFGSAASNWIYGSICGSEAYKGAWSGDQTEINGIETFSGTAYNSYFASKWGAVYDGIQRANDVLRIMSKATDIEPIDQQRISAEARFLRAHYHFEAKKMWDKVPFIDETITYGNGNYHVNNERDIWPEIENDLEYAINNLKNNSYKDAYGRANKYTAMALLAKACMFQKNFSKAQPLLDSIISSNKYELVNYADNFNPGGQNNRESIFIAQMSVNDGANGNNGNYGDILNFPANYLSGTQPGGCCGFFSPSQYLVNHFKTIGGGLPDLDNFNEINVTSDEGIESSDTFSLYTGPLDPRLDWTVGRRGIPYLDWGNHPGKIWTIDQGYAGPYNSKKNVYSKSQEDTFTDGNFWGGFTNQATANRVNLIRFADVLLWAAEVEVERGFLDKAQEYVNMVRRRAADSTGWVHTYVDPADPSKGFTNISAANYKILPYPDGKFLSEGQVYARKAVRFERVLELAMEGHRFFDLVRWGIAYEEIWAYLEKEKPRRYHLKDAVFKKNCNEFFPIPQLQIDLSAGADGIKKMTQSRPCYN